jgi:hypothetical protein
VVHLAPSSAVFTLSTVSRRPATSNICNTVTIRPLCGLCIARGLSGIRGEGLPLVVEHSP